MNPLNPPSPPPYRLWPPVILLTLALSTSAIAQDQPAPSQERHDATGTPAETTGSTEAPTEATAGVPAPDSEPTKPAAAVVERNVYVPFDDLDTVLEGDGRGVFLPFEQFLEIRDQLAQARAQPEPEPPVPAIVHSATHRASVTSEDTITVLSSIEIEAYRKGWSEVALSGHQLGISEAETGEATIVSGESGYRALLPAKGLYEIELTILEPVLEEGLIRRSTLHLPKAAVSKVELTLPATGLDVSVAGGEIAFNQREDDGTTVVSFFAGQREAVEVSWTPAPDPELTEPLVLADVTQTVAFFPGGASSSHLFQLDVLRSPVEGFQFHIPSDHELLAVEGEGLRDWVVANREDHRLLTVRLNAPVLGDYSLTLSFEKTLESTPARVQIPQVLISDAQRQSGTILLGRDAALKVNVLRRENLTRQAYPSSSTGNGALPVAAFRYLEAPYTLEISSMDAPPELRAESETDLLLEGQGVTIESRLSLESRVAPLPSLQIRLPEGWENVTAHGPGVASHSFRDGTLEVAFREPLQGRSELLVRAAYKGGEEVSSLAVPTLELPQALTHDARVAVRPASEIAVSLADPGQFERLEAGNLAFVYRSGDRPPVLELSERQPVTTAEVLALAEVSESSIDYRWQLNYDVRQGAISEVVLGVPSQIAKDLVIEGEELAVDKAAADENLRGANETWAVRFPEPQRDAFSIELRWRQPVPNDDAEPSALAFPAIDLLGVAESSGQIAVRKSPRSDLIFTPANGMAAIAPSALTAALRSPEVVEAFRFQGTQPRLTMVVTARDTVAVPDLRIRWTDIASVMAADGAITAEAIYWVSHEHAGTLKISLPKDAVITSSILVDDTPGTPLKKKKNGELHVHLPARSGDQARQPYPVRFFYEMPSQYLGKSLPSRGVLEVPVPAILSADAAQSRVKLFLPPSYRFTGFESPMHLQEARSGWRQLRQTLDVLIPALGPQIRAVPTIDWAEPPALAGHQRDALTPSLIRDGQSYTFHRLGDARPIQASYLSARFASLVEAGICFLALAFGMLLTRRSLEQKFLYLVFLGFLPLVAAGMVAPHLAEMYRVVFLGALLAIAFWLLMGLWWLIKPHPTPTQPVLGVPVAPPHEEAFAGHPHSDARDERDDEPEPEEPAAGEEDDAGHDRERPTNDRSETSDDDDDSGDEDAKKFKPGKG